MRASMPTRRLPISCRSISTIKSKSRKSLKSRTSKPRPVEAASERDVYATGDPVNLHAEVDDKKYEPVKDAQVTARITKPSGATVEVPMQFNFGEEANDYRGEFTPDEKGLYRLELT